MNPYRIDKTSFYEYAVKTTPENVQEAHEGLFRAKMTLPAAAKHCGMSQKEMKQTFREYLKYHAADYQIPENTVALPRREEQGSI